MGEMTTSEMLQDIEIENFRGISKLRLSFLGPDKKPSRIAVLAGPNGCGKTTVLEACLLACGRANLLRGEHGPGAVRSGAASYRIQATFQDGQTSRSVECGARSASVPVEVSCDYFSSWRAPRLVGAVSVTAGKRGKRPGLTEENRLWTVKQRLVNAKAHESMSSSSSLAGGSPYEEVLQRVRDIWDMFYPGKHESFSVEPVGTDPDEGFDVYLNTSEGGRIPLNSLSSGQLELFLLAGSAIPYQPDASIICIDEPELHLDPQWHRLILRAMMKLRPNCQFIVGTHSPEVYDSVMSYERHFLVPDDDPRARAWAEIGKEDPEACSRT